LINAVMLRTLPVQHPEQLVQVTRGPRDEDGDKFTNPLWEALRERDVFPRGVFAYGDAWFYTAESGEVHEVAGNFVSGQYFQTLGVRRAAGRLLSDADDVRGCAGSGVIG
jgi:hypothetical protein